MKCEKQVRAEGFLMGIEFICGGEIETNGQFRDGDGNEVQVQQCSKCKNVELA